MDDPETQFRVMHSKEDVNALRFKVYGIYEHYANLVSHRTLHINFAN